MNLKNILDPIDKIIQQARDYAQEKDLRKSSIKAIDLRAAQLQPDLEKRKEELRKLLEEISPEENDHSLVASLSNSLSEINELIANIRLVVEREWIGEELDKCMEKMEEQRKEYREKYVNMEVIKLEDDLANSHSFFELAAFANQIWADFELFEEFNREEVVMKFLVDRMNQTNQKNTETHIGRNIRKTLEHIRQNLFKANIWSQEEIDQYVAERNLEIKRLKKMKPNVTRDYRFLFTGASEKLIEAIENEYFWPQNIKLEWFDILKLGKEGLHRLDDCDHLFIVTYFVESPTVKELTEHLAANKISFSTSLSILPSHYFEKIEETVIKKEFNKQFKNSH